MTRSLSWGIPFLDRAIAWKVSLVQIDHDRQDECLLMPVEQDNIPLVNLRNPEFSAKFPSQSGPAYYSNLAARDSIVLIFSSSLFYPCESQTLKSFTPVIQQVLGEARTRTQIPLTL